MGSFERFLAVRADSRKDQKILRNHEVLGAADDARGIRVAWMFPDVLNLHGGRGDLMAIMHFACLLDIPCEIRRVDTLIEEIPFDWADLLYFPSGDLAAVPDIDRALAPKAEAFRAFAARGGMIVAVGSSGAVLAKKTTFQNGDVSEGLGLLNMEMTQRTNSFGDDLWIETADGLEVIATQVSMADVALGEGQEPFAKVVYGRGNCGDGLEGAQTGSVIYTNCLGPVLTKNPRFAQWLIKRCAGVAGLNVSDRTLDDGQIGMELAAMEDVRTFVNKKRNGEIHWNK